MNKRLFIVGSGFTKAVFGNKAPTNAELLPCLRKTEPGLWQTISNRYQTNDIEVALTRLDLDINKAKANQAELIAQRRNIAEPGLWQTISGRYQTDDIEVALTKLDLDINKAEANQTELIAQRRNIESSLARFFRGFRFNEHLVKCQPWLESLIVSSFKPGDVVVCLNYDCLLEGLLDYCDLWTPNGGYGDCLSAPLTLLVQSKRSPVTVLKIHGSENFHRDPVIGSEIDKQFIFTVDEKIFPKSGRRREFCSPEDDSSDAIIAPSSLSERKGCQAGTAVVETKQAPVTIVLPGC